MFILGIFVLLCGSVAFLNGAFGVGLFFLAGGSIITGKAMTDRKYREKTTAAISPAEAAAAKNARSVWKKFAVAGVTFDNEDGTNRQKILKQNCEFGEFGVVECVLQEYQYEGEPAIAVWTQKGRVGNIRRSDVAEVLGLIRAHDFLKMLSIETFINEEDKTIYRADVSFSFDPQNPKDRWYFDLHQC